LKHELQCTPMKRLESPPARGRGLKQQKAPGSGQTCAVAPRAGAWIETKQGTVDNVSALVAPRAGAWIET